MSISEDYLKLAEESGFCLWENESWGPGPGHIDWSCQYDEEFQRYSEALINKVIDVIESDAKFHAGEGDHIKAGILLCEVQNLKGWFHFYGR